jgi:hypothetical protein
VSRTVLIVSPHFPPSTLAGVHRARHLAKHLPAFGWRPIVIRVNESAYTEIPDPGLSALVPSSVQQVFTGALPAQLTRLVGVGDLGIRAFIPLKRAIKRAARLHRPEAILITGSPYYPMLLAGWVRRSLAIPVVLDFQDPWVSAAGAARAAFSKGGAAHRLAVVLEPRAVRHAAYVTSVSERQNADMAARYSWLDKGRLAAIPIGGDPDDYVAVKSPLPHGGREKKTASFEFAYVGSIWPKVLPTVDAFLKSVAGFSQRHPGLAGAVKIRFYGTDARLTSSTIHQIAPMAAQLGLANIVEELPRRLPYLDALSTMANAGALILLGSDEPHYTASKIYPAMMSGRPFLSLFHAASSAHAILARAGGGAALAFKSADELQALVPAATEALRRLATDPAGFGRCDPAAYAPYTAQAVAGRFAEVFDQVAAQNA